MERRAVDNGPMLSPCRPCARTTALLFSALTLLAIAGCREDDEDVSLGQRDSAAAS